MENDINKIKWRSQHGQDRFTLNVLKYKRNGYFVDLGAGPPRHISNTYVMESEFNWKGIAVDIQDASLDPNSAPNGETDFKSFRPNTEYLIEDCLKIDYLDLFKKHNCPTTMDYLSLDLEPPSVTLKCLYLIPFDTYKFNVITFEVDSYRDCPLDGSSGLQRINESREYLKSKGYIFIQNVASVDDYYIHSDLIKN
jgi:hypothetical protein